MAATGKKQTRTTTVRVEEEMVEYLQQEAERVGVVGWSRMLLIIAKEGIEARKKNLKK